MWSCGLPVCDGGVCGGQRTEWRLSRVVNGSWGGGEAEMGAESGLIGRRGVFEAPTGGGGVPGQRPGPAPVGPATSSTAGPAAGGGGERRRRRRTAAEEANGGGGCLDGQHNRAVRGAEVVTEAVAAARKGTGHL